MKRLLETEIKENPDGSATINFDLTDEELQSFIRLGITRALEAGLKEADTYTENSIFSMRYVKLHGEQTQAIMLDEFKHMYKTAPDYVRSAVCTVAKYTLSREDYESWEQTLNLGT